MFDLFIVYIVPAFFTNRLKANFDNKESPKHMHAVENDCHDQYIVVLERYDVPTVSLSRSA